MILEDEGYRVTAAADGRQALALAAETHPEVVLTDLKMPGLSGMDVVRALSEGPLPAARHPHHGPRLGRAGPRGPPARRVRLHEQARRRRRAPLPRRARPREPPARREGAPARAAAQGGRPRDGGRRERRDARGLPPRREDRPDAVDRPREGRVGHRQGARRPGDPLALRPRRRGRSTRSTAPPSPRTSSRASSSGTRRGASPAPRPARPASSRPPPARPSSSTRSATSRSRCRGRSSAPSRSARCGAWAATRRSRRRPRRRRHEPRPRGDDEGGAVPRGPLLPPQRHPHRPAAAARARERHPGARPALPREGERHARDRRSPRSTRPPSTSSSATPGRGTSGSSRASSSGPSSSARGRP